MSLKSFLSSGITSTKGITFSSRKSKVTLKFNSNFSFKPPSGFNILQYGATLDYLPAEGFSKRKKRFAKLKAMTFTISSSISSSGE